MLLFAYFIPITFYSLAKSVCAVCSNPDFFPVCLVVMNKNKWTNPKITKKNNKKMICVTLLHLTHIGTGQYVLSFASKTSKIMSLVHLTGSLGEGAFFFFNLLYVVPGVSWRSLFGSCDHETHVLERLREKITFCVCDICGHGTGSDHIRVARPWSRHPLTTIKDTEKNVQLCNHYMSFNEQLLKSWCSNRLLSGLPLTTRLIDK